MKVTIVIETRRGSVQIEQATTERHARPTRGGKEVLDAACRDARAWLRANPELPEHRQETGRG